LPTPEEEERMVRGALARLDARLSSRPREASGPILLDDADVQSAPPTPGAPALQKEEKAPDPPPPVTAGGTPALPAPRTPAFLVDTSRSPKAEAAVHEALVAAGLRPARPAPTVRVVGAGEHTRTVELPVMDPSQGGARRPLPELTLQDYVAYRTELELWPEHRAYVHEKYKVEGEVAHQELVRDRDRRLAAAPTMRGLAEAMRASWLERGRAMERARSGGV
jgi:hypothetical protein